MECLEDARKEVRPWVSCGCGELLAVLRIVPLEGWDLNFSTKGEASLTSLAPPSVWGPLALWGVRPLACSQ